jgi:nucleotide-binding universal stress UspA family protein
MSATTLDSERDSMHVMVATDGKLDAKKAADIAARLAGDGGRVTVFTAVEVPRQMIDDIRAATADSDADLAREKQVEYRRTQAEDAPVSNWLGDDTIVAKYVNRCVADRTAELVAELTSAGVEHRVVGEEGESAARSVLEAAKANDVDVVCIGTHGLGRFEGLLGSLSTKVARLAPCSVVLVR